MYAMSKDKLAELRERRKNQNKSELQFEQHAHKKDKEDIRHLTSKMMLSMATMLDGDLLPRTIRDGMTATYINKAGDEVPDHRVRLDAAKLALSYLVGMPIQRQEQVNYNFDMSELDPAQIVEQLAQSPAMLEKVKAMVMEAEGKVRVTDI